MATQQKQRASELNQWRNAHPALAAACREAAEALTRVQIEYLDRMTDEINDTSDDMVEGEFMLNEFVDRYGPRLAHLNGVIQVLAQLEQRAEPGQFAARLSRVVDDRQQTQSGLASAGLFSCAFVS